MFDAKPFIRWVGGKRQLLPELLPRVPKDFRTYHEPFVGGGALFFALQPKLAVLSDKNERLVRTYIAIRDHVEMVIDNLSEYKYEKEAYLETRANPPDSGNDHDVAAWFIYINRAGFNGLWRVNAKGQCNVPFGKYSNPLICNADNLRACSQALQGAEILYRDFRVSCAFAHDGDFCYLDPPYVPVSKSANFTAYTSGGFTINDQQDLLREANAMRARGAHVMISNSVALDTTILRTSGGWLFDEVSARRAVNCDATKRGPVKELLIRSEPHQNSFGESDLLSQ